MEFIEVESLNKYLFLARPIGIGTTAICFLMKDGRVIKVFLNTWHKKDLFKFRDIKEHLMLLNSLNNESYIGPDEVITINGEVVAYTMRYCPGKYIHSFNKNIRINELVESYKKLIEDTYKISDANFRLGDLHDKNIFYNDGFRVIDLDNGKYCDYYDSKRLQEINMNDLVYNIICSMFGVGFNYDIFFNDNELESILKKILANEYLLYDELLKEVSSYLGLSNPAIGDLQKAKKKILSVEKRMDYYGRYC